MALVLSHWNMGILLTKVTQGVCDPKELRAKTGCDNILKDRYGELERGGVNGSR
jgi:hypothetical protein